MSKEKINKKNLIWKYTFTSLLILIGIILTVLKIGDGFLGFPSIGLWLLYVSFIMLAITIFQPLSNKNKVIDERMQFVATKSAKITFSSVILFEFGIMILDGIKPITIPYSYFMSYLICGTLLVYVISYKILWRSN